MDHNLVIWKLDTQEISDRIDESANYTDGDVFPTIRIYENSFMTHDIHQHYVDSVCWFGSFSFLSRSHMGDLVWWKLGALGESEPNFQASSATKIYTLKEKDEDAHRIWFLRTQMDQQGKFLALGDIQGKINLWDFEAESVEDMKKWVVSSPKSTKTIRMVTFSANGSILLAASDDGKIFRFDKK
jgi:WD40 repeat protein